MDIYGPYEHGEGPREVYGMLMRSPVFPVDLREVGSHIRCHNIEYPNSTVLLIHPRGGRKIFDLASFEQLTNNGRQMPFGDGKKFPVSECLVVRMHRSNHPEQTISYRFEERPTGKVFVFVTDHENQDGIPASFRAHVSGADLLVMDCQYDQNKYERMTAGWGHATPSYVARVAKIADARKVGATHHDPPSSDDTIDGIVATIAGLLEGLPMEVFGCKDYLEVEV